MTTFVVPLDGSEFSERSLRPACALAIRAAGRVVLVTCDQQPKAATAYLEDRAALFADVLEIEVRVLDERPAAGILSTADSIEDSLLCMAGHGHGGLRTVVLGSVANEVVCRSPAPIVIVGPNCRAALLPEEAGRMVTCFDGSEFSESIVPAAARWARDLRLSPWLVEVVGPDEQVALDDAFGGPRWDEIATAALQRLAGLFEARGVPAEVQVLHGADASRSITDFAARLPAVLVAMATHGRTGLNRVALGSVAMNVVRRSPCPVLVTRPPALSACDG